MGNPATVEAKKLFALIPREVVLHRMETSDCLDARLFWAIVLWTWCYPDPSDYVVQKGEDGRVLRDRKGDPVPGKLKDLRELLGLAPGAMGALSRAAARLEEVGAIRFGDTIQGFKHAKLLYIVQQPISPDDGLKLPVQATLKWSIGSRTVTIDTLPEDKVARTKAIEWLNSLNEAWCTDLRMLRDRHNTLLVQGASEHGIIIGEKLRTIREEPPPPQHSVNGSNGAEKASRPQRENRTGGATKAEEEEGSLYQKFKANYPGARFDEAKAKAAFEALPVHEKRRCLERLEIYRQCERWVRSQAEDNGRWIPLASKWLTLYEADPDPYIEPVKGRREPVNEDEAVKLLEQWRKGEAT